jgi:hypothetical protein
MKSTSYAQSPNTQYLIYLLVFYIHTPATCYRSFCSRSHDASDRTLYCCIAHAIIHYILLVVYIYTGICSKYNLNAC